MYRLTNSGGKEHFLMFLISNYGVFLYFTLMRSKANSYNYYADIEGSMGTLFSLEFQ